MNKTWIIIKREFLSRTRKKTFLLTTILLPLLIFGSYAAMIYFSVNGESNKRIAILDGSDLFNGKIEPSSRLDFDFVDTQNADGFKSSFQQQGYDAYLLIPADLNLQNPSNIVIYGKEQVGMGTQERIKDRVNKAIEKKQIQQKIGDAVSVESLDSIKANAEIRSVSLQGGEEKESNATVASMAALVTGLLIYFVLMIYGSMVMRGVMEEKTNRIAEVMVSSVRPFQLMMGKILGIGAVGLVQFLIWIILIVSLQPLLPILFPGVLEEMAAQAGNVNLPGQTIPAPTGGPLLSALSSINFTQLILGFLIYFLGGYFMYSSLFAAVGSSVNEDAQDAQQLILPIMMPIIFSFIMLTQVIQDPHSGLAVFGSLFPLTSPIVMMGRIPFGVPGWQLALSVALLVAGFICTTWLAAKIYRTGILMYGKKITWKEMWKWVMR